MTRFARAKGSKASNERTPEEATSWVEMKQQLLEKNKQIEDTKKKQKADEQREKNYKSFLEEVEEEKSKNTAWADFPLEKPKKKTKSESQMKKVKKPPKVIQSTEQPTKGIKRKLIDNEDSTKKVNKKQKLNDQAKKKKFADPSTLSESDLKKIEKKKQRRIRQLEKRKLRREELKKQQETNPETIEKPKQEINPHKQTPLKRKPFQKVAPKIKNKDTNNKKRRKEPQQTMIINGKEVEIAYVDGFPIKKEDAERIKQLRKQMISKGLPRSEIKIALKLERRKAEKAFAREKKKVCFNCRKSGHNLSECPQLGEQQLAESAGTGICFKCGSTEHTHFECKVVRGQEFKYAQCFICHEQGHIARQCPDNARGLYPKGGACKMCGDVTHLKKDCPQYQAQQQKEQDKINLETMDGDNPDNLDTSKGSNIIDQTKRVNKIIKF